MELTSVIIRPYLTEKTYAKRNETRKKYAFIVHKNATKHDIKLAFESIFEIEPEEVKTMIRKPSMFKTGTANPGWIKVKKIAYITLPKGKDISLSQEEVENKKDVSSEKEIKVTPKATEPSTENKIKEAIKIADEKTPVKATAKKEKWRKATNKNY